MLYFKFNHCDTVVSAKNITDEKGKIKLKNRPPSLSYPFSSVDIATDYAQKQKCLTPSSLDSIV